MEEQLHDLELHLGQLDLPPGLEENTAVLIQHKFPADQRGGGIFVCSGAAARAAHPAAEGLHTGQQLTDAEGLGHIVIRADGQAADLVLLLPLGTQDDDADLLVGAADGLAEREPIHAGQHHIQNGSITAGLLLQQRQGGFGAIGLHRLHPRQPQVQRDHLADAGFILYHKYLDHWEPPYFSIFSLCPRAHGEASHLRTPSLHPVNFCKTERHHQFNRYNDRDSR